MYRRLLCAAGLIAVQLAAFAQAADIRAITDDGRNVLLSPDGKWRFDKHPVSKTTSTPTQSASPFQTRVKSLSVDFDTSQWVIAPKDDNNNEFNKTIFINKSHPLVAFVIADEIVAPLDSLKKAVLFNGNRAADAGVTVVLDETENINGKTIGNIRMVASIQHTNFLIATRYYVGPEGNIQVTCGAPQELFAKYAEECKKFLNGLTIAE